MGDGRWTMGDRRGNGEQGTRECERVSSAAPSRVWGAVGVRLAARREGPRSPEPWDASLRRKRGGLRVPAELCTPWGACKCAGVGMR
jgi:hypothetical protein